MALDLLNIGRTVQHELNTVLMGKRLGGGVYREVYEVMGPQTGLVVKIEHSDTKEFCNVAEWHIWNEVKGTAWEPWFAPCVSISHSGSVLIMKRTKPLKRMPLELPEIFADTHIDNWGTYKGRVVCHDYGFHAIMERGLKGKVKMGRASQL